MSWVEVESKIKVHNASDARRRIKKFAKFVKIEKKEDDYYTLESAKYPKRSLRVRDKGRKREVNFKEWREYEDGIWAKKEVEFEVSDLNNFFNLLEDFGFRKWMKKDKRTELYRTKDGVNIELNHVRRLGWFIEIEVLCQPKEIRGARKKVAHIRSRLGAKKKDIVKKGYTKQLWELRR
jgi:predicted adenylyl cyclase CyaB